MKLFIVILLINVVYLFGEMITIHKTLLRGAYKEEQERLIKQMFKTTFDNIFDKIIESAKTGKNEYHFTIVCYPLEYSSDEHCEIRNIGERKEWSRGLPFITKNQFRKNVLDALHQTFPDSNFTKTYKNCCEHYSIEW